MKLDYSIDYDASIKDFTGSNVMKIINGPCWITVHTDKGAQFMYETFGLAMPINMSMRFSYVNTSVVKLKLKNSKLNGIYGGFHY